MKVITRIVLLHLIVGANANLVKEFLSAHVEETRSMDPDKTPLNTSLSEDPRLAPDLSSSESHGVSRNLSDALLCDKYGPWSGWSRCNPKCEQARVRACRKQEECGDAWIKEKRTCSRREGRECKTMSYKVIGQSKRDRMIEDILYDLLYAPWSDWGPCLRSCRQRRKRECKYSTVCSQSYIQEERRCRMPGHYCERRYTFQLNAIPEDTDGSDVHDSPAAAAAHLPDTHASSLVPSAGSGEETETDAETVEKNLGHLVGSSRKGSAERWDRTAGERNSKHGRKQRKRKRKKPWQRKDRRSRRKARKGDFRRRRSCGLRPIGASYRVVGGQEVIPNSWPWQVAILTQKNKDHYCGGTLIAPTWVLTAAHCVKKRGRPRKFLVRVGEHNISASKAGQEPTQADIRPEISIPHPDFDYPTISNDIALVKLQHPPSAFSRPGYACLPQRDFRPSRDQLCYIVGWGKTRNTHIYGSERLREAQVPVVRHRKCQRVFDYPISKRQVCAGYRQGGTDSCAGDSGGPLLCSVTRGSSGTPRYAIYGVTSYGEGCGRKGKYGIYTRVNTYLRWIEQTIRRNS